MRISVVICNFNGEPYLARALNSIASQSYHNFQVVFVDNHSSDKSRSIFLSFNDKYSWSADFCFNDRNKGQYASRNIGLSLCDGDVAVFLDVDDEWNSDFLQTVVTRFHSLECAPSLITFNFYARYESLFGLRRKIINTKTFAPLTVADCVNNYRIPIFLTAFRLDTVKENSIQFDERLNYIGDFEFFVRILNESSGVIYSDTMGTYSVRRGSESSRLRKQLGDETRRVASKFLDEGIISPLQLSVLLERAWLQDQAIALQGVSGAIKYINLFGIREFVKYLLKRFLGVV